MNEKTTSIWKKSWKLPGLVVMWVALMVITVLIFTAIACIVGSPFNRIWGLPGVVAVGCIVATAVLCFCLFFQWVCCWKNFRRFLFGSACFATLVALFYAVEDWRGWRAWTQFKQEQDAKGIHFDMASVAPASVPDDQNFAMTPIAYSSYGNMLTRDGKEIPYGQRDTNFVNRMSIHTTSSWWNDPSEPTNGIGNWPIAMPVDLAAWQSYYRALATKTNDFPVPAQPQSPAADVLFALKKYDGAIEELRTASRLPSSRFPLTYDKESPAAILLPPLASLKSCSLVLQLRSLAELHLGETDKALDDVQLGLQLADKIKTEPFLISHLVRIAMVQIMLQPVWEGLANHKWSDAQLAALDTELSNFNFPADFQRGLLGELAGQNGECDRLRRHPQDLEGLDGDWAGDDSEGVQSPNLPGAPLAYLIPGGWFYQNQYHSARTMLQYFVPAADAEHRTISPEKIKTADMAIKADSQSSSLFTVLERMTLRGLKTAARKFAFGQASVDLARTAIALERYRLAHGNFPESLDALVPEFVVQTPHDVIGGQPLKYHLTVDGRFVLYSIGWNETDDGGQIAFRPSANRYEEGATRYQDITQGDWVWRYPQK